MDGLWGISFLSLRDLRFKLSILRSKYGNSIYFLLRLGKMCVSGPCVFKIDDKK